MASRSHKCRPWTDEERRLVREEYRRLGRRVIASQLGRTPDQVKYMARRLGVCGPKGWQRIWTSSRQAAFADVYRVSVAAARKQFGLTRASAYRYAQRFGIAKQNIKPWTPWEKELVLALWPAQKSIVVERTGRTRNAIRTRACLLRREATRNAILAAQRDEWFEPRGLPDEPTSARPGSPEKLQVLAARAEAGVELWHPRDDGSYGFGRIAEIIRALTDDE